MNQRASKASDIISLPEKPYGLKISEITQEGILVYWKKLSVADGYEVYRSYSDVGPAELIKVIARKKVGTYLDDSFDHSKRNVFYSIRSFLNLEDGTKAYSQWVGPVKAQYIENLCLDRDITYIYDGDQRKLRALYGWGEPKDGVWSSTNREIAEVDEHGVITGKATGACDICFSSKSLAESAVSRVVVNRKEENILHDYSNRYAYNENEGYWENPRNENDGDAVIMMVGDLMCGKHQMTVQNTEEDGWDFCDSFECVKEITTQSDFAIGNLETLLAPGWPYMLDEAYIDNFNNCNATPRYLEAVRYGGFDAVATSNNHNCDGGVRALKETIEQLNRYNFIHTGIFQDSREQRFFIVNVKGIKVGYLAYMSQYTGFNKKDATWSMEEKELHLNIFSEEKAQKDIALCREKGAEFVVVYMHWGKKNYRQATNEQRKEAKLVADAGADYIVGANPHLVQEYDVIDTSDRRQVPCYYSTGNFQAYMNQVEGNRDSIIVRIHLRRDELGKIQMIENDYIPCHTYTTIGDYHLVPVCVSERYNTGVQKASREKHYNYLLNVVGEKVNPL